ncbi:dynamin family protein [Catellatospora citrea]|uniref:Dynamin n=1 Tax=Catellatospora citrea TaxID=53366 RepID=A0A8J3NYD7_9ACTN|nr:dynamin family protein [Catellatospora citrea]RKE11176.1 dynamin family protein [Catellatospora citrea]GIF96641.1 dynamin [Catellatospora citrea]
MTLTSRHVLAPDAIEVTGRVADAAEQAGDEQTALVLRHQAQLAAMPGSTLVVVGEKNRGKSSLINALVEREDLLPVNADIATHAYIVVRHGVPESAAAFTDDASDGEPIEVAQIAEYAGLSGEGESREPLHPEVIRVEVAVDAPVLREGLVLVDTPGVGGLVAGHTAVTLATLQRADALVFVVNSASELTSSELAFLRKAAEHTSTVLFVLTRIDTFGDHRQVLDKNLALLREHAPALAAAPWFPVSSRRRLEAGRALADGDAEFAGRLQRTSGFEALVTELRDKVLLRVEHNLLSALVAAGADTVEQLDASAAGSLRLLTPDEATLAAIVRQQESTGDLADPDAAWRAELNRRFAGLRDDLRRRAGEGVRRLRDQADAAIEEGGRDMLTAVPRDFADGGRGLTMALENDLREEVIAVTTWLAGALGLAGIDATPPSGAARPAPSGPAAGGGPATGPVEWPTPSMAEGRDLFDQLKRYGDNVAKPAAAAGRRVTELWRQVPPVKQKNLLILGVAAAVTATIGAVTWFIRRGKAATRRQLTEDITQSVASLHGLIDTQVIGDLDGLRTEIAANAGRQLARRMSYLAESLAEAQANLQAAEAELAPRRAVLELRRKELAELRAEVAAVKDRLARGKTW